MPLHESRPTGGRLARVRARAEISFEVNSLPRVNRSSVVAAVGWMVFTSLKLDTRTPSITGRQTSVVMFSLSRRRSPPSQSALHPTRDCSTCTTAHSTISPICEAERPTVQNRSRLISWSG